MWPLFAISCPHPSQCMALVHFTKYSPSPLSPGRYHALLGVQLRPYRPRLLRPSKGCRLRFSMCLWLAFPIRKRLRSTSTVANHISHFTPHCLVRPCTHSNTSLNRAHAEFVYVHFTFTWYASHVTHHEPHVTRHTLLPVSAFNRQQ